MPLYELQFTFLLSYLSRSLLSYLAHHGNTLWRMIMTRGLSIARKHTVSHPCKSKGDRWGGLPLFLFSLLLVEETARVFKLQGENDV